MKHNCKINNKTWYFNDSLVRNEGKMNQQWENYMIIVLEPIMSKVTFLKLEPMTFTPSRQQKNYLK